MSTYFKYATALLFSKAHPNLTMRKRFRFFENAFHYLKFGRGTPPDLARIFQGDTAIENFLKVFHGVLYDLRDSMKYFSARSYGYIALENSSKIGGGYRIKKKNP